MVGNVECQKTGFGVQMNKNLFFNLQFRFFGLILCLLFFSVAAIAQVTVSLESIQPFQQFEVYQNELVSFKILVLNLGSERLTGEKIRVRSENFLFLENNELKPEQLFIVPELFPSQAVELRLVAKAPAVVQEKARIGLDFGLQRFSNRLEKDWSIIPSPLHVTLQPDQSAKFSGEVFRIGVLFRNDSNQTVYQLKGTLLSSQRADILTAPVFVSDLSPLESSERFEFEYWPRPLALDSHEAVFQTRFSDERGEHTLDHRVSLQVWSQRIGSSWILLLLAILLIVAGFWYWNQQKQKP